LSEGTVRSKVSEVLAKLGARNRAEAIRIARDNGWL
jgi:two-component system response regulator DesR